MGWTTPLLLWSFVELRRMVVDAHARAPLKAAGLPGDLLRRGLLSVADLAGQNGDHHGGV